MWEKILRSSQSLNYRKRYKCPRCKMYSIYILHDKSCECENNCDVNTVNIASIMEKNDYDGYYTSEQIKDYFEDKELDKMFEEITINNILHLLTIEEKETIESFFNKTYLLDNQLDSIVIDYFNNNKINNDKKISPFGYFINLIEDTHFFVNLCSKDIILFNYGIEFATQNFYSARFFFHNSLEHLFQAIERIYVILGILYGYNFKSDLTLNKNHNIEKYLNTNSDYKKSKIKKIIKKLKRKKSFKELKTIRQVNNHDLSYYSKIIEEDINSKKDGSFGFWNRDGNLVDKDIYLPKIKDIIYCLNEVYNVMDEIILQIVNDKNIYSLQYFPMIDKFTKLHDKKTVKKYSNQDLKKLKQYKMQFSKNFMSFRDSLINDIFFRINEVIHCIVDIYNIVGDRYYKYWNQHGIYELSSLIDYQYLLYSSIFRLYSCYDKIARYIVKINSDEITYKRFIDNVNKNKGLLYDETSSIYGINHFNDFKNVVYNNIVVNKIKDILDDEEYKLLYRLRNDIYHNLRAGCLYGEEGMDIYNYILLDTIFKNVVTMFDLLNFLRLNNKINPTRNEPCFCGSGKKYKKCCGR